MTENVSQNVGLITKSREKSRILTAFFFPSHVSSSVLPTQTACGAQEGGIFFQEAFPTESSNIHFVFPESSNLQHTAKKKC